MPLVGGVMGPLVVRSLVCLLGHSTTFWRDFDFAQGCESAQFPGPMRLSGAEASTLYEQQLAFQCTQVSWVPTRVIELEGPPMFKGF